MFYLSAGTRPAGATLHHRSNMAKYTDVNGMKVPTALVAEYTEQLALLEAARAAKPARPSDNPEAARAYVAASAAFSLWCAEHDTRSYRGAPASRAGKRQAAERRAMEQARRPRW